MNNRPNWFSAATITLVLAPAERAKLLPQSLPHQETPRIPSACLELSAAWAGLAGAPFAPGLPLLPLFYAQGA